jgi:hypothetical protein
MPCVFTSASERMKKPSSTQQLFPLARRHLLQLVLPKYLSVSLFINNMVINKRNGESALLLISVSKAK